MDVLLHISAIDPQIIERCRPDQRYYHSIIGLMLVVLAGCTVLAVWYALYLLNAGFFLSLAGGMVFAVMLMNLYRFFFITISCRATYDEHLILKNPVNVTDALRLTLLGFLGGVIGICFELFIYRDYIEQNATEEDRMGIVSREIWLGNELGLLHYVILMLFIFAFLIPIVLKLYFKPLRNGEYEWIRNQLENQRIKDQYAYAKDTYERILRKTAGKYLREDFKPEDSFCPDPFEGKILDADARVNIPIAMADDMVYDDIEASIKEQEKIGDSIQTCDYCGQTKISVKILDTGLSRCAACDATALEDEDELHQLFSKALHFFEMHHVSLPRYVRPKFATPQEIASFSGKTFMPTAGFDVRAVGVAAPPSLTKDVDTIYIEKGFPANMVFATIIHELVHVWQFNNLNASLIENTGKGLIYIEGLARWAEIDALEKIGAYDVVAKMHAVMEMSQDEYAKGYMLVNELLRKADAGVSPFHIYLDLFLFGDKNEQ